MFRFPIAPGFDETQYPIRQTTSAAEKCMRIEFEWKHLPDLVSRQREHRVWLTLYDSADRALDHGARKCVSGPHFHYGIPIKRPVRLQADGNVNLDSPVAVHARGRAPATPEMPHESVHLIRRQLVRARIWHAEPDRAVDHIAGRSDALRGLLVELFLDLARIEFRLLLLGRRLGLRFGFHLLVRLGVGLLLLGL